MSDHNSPLTEAERTQYRSAVGQLNWVAEISRPEFLSSSDSLFARPLQS